MVFLTAVTTDSTVTAVTTIYFFTFLVLGKCNLTHLTDDVMFSGQRFAILAMFIHEIGMEFFIMKIFFFILKNKGVKTIHQLPF